MKRNRSIDAVRAIACSLVLFVHCPFPDPLGTLVSAQARFAVPFFLMTSGFFAYRRNMDETYAAAFARLKSTAALTLAGTAFYAVSNSIRDGLCGRPPLSWLNALLNPTGIFEFFIFNRALFLSSVMYYLFALLYVYGIFILLAKTRLIEKAELLIAPLLVLCVVLDEFLSLPWYYSGNFLLTGLPFFLLGHRIAAGRLRMTHPERFLLPGFALVCLESTLLGEAYCYIGTLILSVSLFLTCLKYPGASLPQGLVSFGRNCAVYVFIIHCAVRDYLKLLLPVFPSMLFPLVTLGLSILLSMLCCSLINKTRKIQFTA